MIHVDLPAAMECIQGGCQEKLSVRLAVTVGGTLLPRVPTGHGWQIVAQDNGVIVCRCPAHHAAIETAQPRLIGATH